MLKIAICDDEQKEVEKMDKLVQKIMENIGEKFSIDYFINGRELVESSKIYNIVFLDIRMNDLDGIKIGEKLIKEQDDINIIYVTNYTQYCLEVINRVHAFAYLKKPVNEVDLQKQLMVAIERIHYNLKQEKVYFEILILEQCQTKKIYKEFILKDIYYFEFVNRRIMIKMNKDEYFFYGKLIEIESRFGKNGFVRCHNAFVVNMKHILRIHNHEITLDNNLVIPVSQKRSTQFRKKFNDYLHNIS